MREIGEQLRIVVANIDLAKNESVKRLKNAVGLTVDQMREHAKDNHAAAMSPHSMRRYQNRTGTLTRSIDSDVPIATDKVVEGYVGTSIEYAPHLELGTGRMQPYPFLMPALLAFKDIFKNRVFKVLGK